MIKSSAHMFLKIESWDQSTGMKQRNNTILYLNTTYTEYIGQELYYYSKNFICSLWVPVIAVQLYGKGEVSSHIRGEITLPLQFPPSSMSTK